MTDDDDGDGLLPMGIFLRRFGISLLELWRFLSYSNNTNINRIFAFQKWVD